MSVRNGEKYVMQSIDSILKQSFNDFEFIIINDSSTDSTLKILEKIKDKRVILINNKKKLGLTKSLNIGLKKARGEIIGRMDADDISIKNRFLHQINYLKKYQDVGVLGSWVKVIDDKNKVTGEIKFPRTDKEIKDIIFKFNPIRHSSVFFRKMLIDKYGIYDEKLDGAEDYDLWLRYSRQVKLTNLSKYLLKYRIHRARVSDKEEKKVLKSAIFARVKAVSEYKYPFYKLVYLIIPIITFFIPNESKTMIRNGLHSFIIKFKQISSIILRYLIYLIQKTTVLTSLGIRLVKITGKYPEAIHPKHLIAARETWFIKYLSSNDLVLDIGCNNCQNTIKAARVCRKVIGFDLDQNQIDIAKRTISKNKIKNIKLLIHNAEEKLPFKKNTFDTILFFAVLEHLKNREKAISEVYRILKDGGKLLLSVPNKDTTWKNIQKKVNLNYFSDSDHKIEFSKSSIYIFLKNNGFRNIEIYPVSFDMPFVGVIDFLGGISLSIYKFLSLVRRKLVIKYPKESVSFEVLAFK